MIKVGVIGPNRDDSFAENILNALSELDIAGVHVGTTVPQHSSKLLNQARAVAQRQTARGEEIGQRALVRSARELGDLDLIINVERRVMPRTIRAMKQASHAKVVLWYPDHIANIGRLELASDEYDAIFLKDELFASRMRKTYGINAVYLAEGCTPKWHSSSVAWGTSDYVAVVGNIYPTRARLIQRLIDDGVPITAYGSRYPGWMGMDFSAIHAGRSVFHREKADTFRSARAVLNNLHPAEMTSVNCRLFEATCAGAVVLCEDRPALRSLFKAPDEVLPFDSYAQLLSQCRAVLSPDFDGRSIGDAAARRAQGEHTIRHRVSRIMESVS